MSRSKAKKFTYIDLFSGCGGLSLGLEKAGFELALAVEKSEMAAETFYHNFVKRLTSKEEWLDFCDQPAIKQAEKKLIVNEVGCILEDKALQKALREKNIDLIAGGPPCQGFSMAGRRNPKDIRNKLPWQFLEIVELLEPKAVIIENVLGMSQNFVKHDQEAPFNQLKKALEQIGPGYKAQQVLFNAMHFGAPQHRPRVLLIALRADLAHDYKFFDGIWRSDFDAGNLFNDRPDFAPVASHFGKKIKTVKDALWDISDRGYKHHKTHDKYQQATGNLACLLRQDTSWMSTDILKTGTPEALQNHVLRNHSEHIQERFRLYQVLRDCGIPSRILNIPMNYAGAAAYSHIQDFLRDATGDFVAPDGVKIAKSKKALADLIIRLGTKKHSQRPLKWDAPSPTVVSLPDDFVHPSAPRTLTVRELARFQTFPDQFIFRAKETTGSHRRRFEVPQYTQVGNAVPPIMAEAVGTRMLEILQSCAASAYKRKVA